MCSLTCQTCRSSIVVVLSLHKSGGGVRCTKLEFWVLQLVASVINSSHNISPLFWRIWRGTVISYIYIIIYICKTKCWSLYNDVFSEQGIIIMQSSPTLSSPSSLSDEEESNCSSRKSLLHLHDDTRTFLGLLYARRQYPSEPPPTYSHVMRHKEQYPLKQNMMWFSNTCIPVLFPDLLYNCFIILYVIYEYGCFLYTKLEEQMCKANHSLFSWRNIWKFKSYSFISIRY